jgi:molybdopterin molybdotransferase
MITQKEAIAIVDAAVGARRLPTERISVHEAGGRFLTSDQVSKVDLPPFDKSSMDGYAVLDGDTSESFRLKGVVPAGQPCHESLEPGTTVKVMTGAPVPAGTGRVIIVEEAVEEGGVVRFENPSDAKNVHRKATDVAAGDIILKAGRKLGPVEIANLIGSGITKIDVARKVKMAIISTGDELVDSASNLGPGKIMNTNGPLLHHLCRKAGFAITSEEWAPDDPAKLTAALRRAMGSADIILLTGGLSAGDFDYAPGVIKECGFEIHFSRVAIKPGKPLTFATDAKRILFGLPGNPVSVFVMFHLFVLRAAALLSGGAHEPKQFSIRLAEPYRRRAGERMAYFPCRIREDGFAEPVRYSGSAHLAALVNADGFCIIPKGVNSLEANADVSFMLL